jgi:CDP-glucose 4,6-dehydratase
MIKPQFWSGKRVLVTGHTGFKGAWLAFWLQQMGAKVSGIALAPSTDPNIFSALNLAADIDHRTIDIRERSEIQAALKAINPEIVFHLAAQPLVRASYVSPMETYETNVIGTGNVLTGLLNCSAVRSIVVITTDKCYENREWHWGYRETDALGGYDPYSSSKACAEILTASFRRSFFTPEKNVGVATVRAGNVIGGGDWSPDRLIPDIVRTLRQKGALEIRYPEAIRPWQHVLSPLSGYLMLGERLYADPLKWSEGYNFAPVDDDCVPVRRILELFGQSWGEAIRWSQPAGVQAHEAHFLKLDASKAKATIGWQPKWNLEQALKATATWYRTFYENPGQLKSLTLQQIRDYTA